MDPKCLFTSCLKDLYFTLLAEHIMKCKFPDSPCTKMAYKKDFLFLCHIIQQSQVSACSFSWFSTFSLRRGSWGIYLSSIIFITFWTSLLASSLGLIFVWDKPFETDLKTNSCWPRAQGALKEHLDLHDLHSAVLQVLPSEGMLRHDCRSSKLLHIFLHRKKCCGSLAFLFHFLKSIYNFCL